MPNENEEIQTTTSDSIYGVNDNGEASVRIASEVTGDPTSIYGVDENGNACVRVMGSGGGGGGDQHNLGWYATESALEEAHPTAEAGDWAIVGATDTVWIWDTDNEEWVDSDQKGQVTSVNGQTGDVVLDLLPSQTGQSGKFLTTDGTDASWSDKPLVNASSNNTGISIRGSTGSSECVFIGDYSGGLACNYSVYIGRLSAPAGGAGHHNVAVGYDAKTATNAYGCVQLGSGTCGNGEFCVALSPSFGAKPVNYTVMKSDGTIPEARLADTTNAQEGDVLTLDSNGNAVWQASSGGGLPDQTGQSGKFLTTDGTDASWSDKPLVNTNPTASTTVIIGNNNGSVSSVGNNAVCLTHMGSYGGWIALGNNAIAIGSTKNSLGAYSINIGGSSCDGNYAIQLGGNGINSDANTFKVGNANGNFEMMSADGTIPTARLTKVNSTITLTAAGWSSNTQTVSVTGMTATGVVIVSPDPTDQSAYTSNGILCTAQAAGTLTFTCDTVPSGDIDVNVVML